MNIHSTLIEDVAQAICCPGGCEVGGIYHESLGCQCVYREDEAKAAIATVLEAMRGAPDEVILAPRKPDDFKYEGDRPTVKYMRWEWQKSVDAFAREAGIESGEKVCNQCGEMPATHPGGFCQGCAQYEPPPYGDQS